MHHADKSVMATGAAIESIHTRKPQNQRPARYMPEDTLFFILHEAAIRRFYF
jgi:hypothetical protein